jgi:hypothetical protein
MTLTAEWNKLRQEVKRSSRLFRWTARQKKKSVRSILAHADDRNLRICLFALRGYLLLIFGLPGFRVLQLTGVIHS